MGYIYERRVKKNRYWQNWVSVVLGVWICASPWVFRSPVVGDAAMEIPMIATWATLVVGLLIMIVAIGALLLFEPWEEWINVILGGWLMSSPWVLKLSAEELFTWNIVVAGGLVVVFAASVIAAAKMRDQRSPFL